VNITTYATMVQSIENSLQPPRGQHPRHSRGRSRSFIIIGLAVGVALSIGALAYRSTNVSHPIANSVTSHERVPAAFN
jgi:hypothetical protein